MAPPVLIVGIGNDYRSDDGVGLVVARALAARALAGIEVIEQAGDGAALLDVWRDAHAVILIDAMVSGARGGTVHGSIAHAEPIPTRFLSSSSHAFGVAEAIDLARALGQLPPYITVYGIEGQRFTAGKIMSPAVGRAARAVVERVADEALALLGQASAGTGTDSAAVQLPTQE